MSFRLYLKENPARLFRNKFRETVGPFDHGDTIAKKVLIEAKSRGGLWNDNTRKTEMKNRQSPSRTIFRKDGKCGASHIRAAAQPVDDTFDEQCFPAP